MIKSENDYFCELLAEKEKELVKANLFSWIYGNEVANPTSIGKYQAEENLMEWSKRIKYLKEEIELMKRYGKAQKYEGF